MTEIIPWDTPEFWTVHHVAAHYDVTEATVTREWVHWPQWPAATEGLGKRRATRGRPMKVYPRDAVEAAIRAHTTTNPEFGPPTRPDRHWPRHDRVTLAEIARRLDRDYVEIRNYPRLYPDDSTNPFPTTDTDGLRSWGEVIDWHTSRRGMGNRSTTKTTPPTDNENPR
ncbi:hypothetical protein [Embleya scabrispora]|uniref:hypothetical protein n=1 Tax=Embleya scabrispora TaxID=159449 RepID=UPI00037D0BAF|nr:hypothetical protein [Embleya scabrispora]MYS81036.1 hypothetical protein [Streptomyces sp. SID5474]